MPDNNTDSTELDSEKFLQSALPVAAAYQALNSIERIHDAIYF